MSNLSLLIPGKLYTSKVHNKVVWNTRDFHSIDNRKLNINELFMLIDVCHTGCPGEVECGILLNNKLGIMYLKENRINLEVKLVQ